MTASASTPAVPPKPAVPAAGMTPQPRSGGTLLLQMSQKFGIDPDKMLSTMKATVFDADATVEEMTAFASIANRYDLDPFKGEIYAFRKKGAKKPDGTWSKGGIQAIVGIAGWSTIINRHPAFDGLDYEDNWSDDGKMLRSVTCIIWRKDRSRPTRVTEYMVECRQETFPWKNFPVRMLRHKATIQCARMALGVTGVMDDDEFARLERSIDVTVRDVTGVRSAVPAMERLRSLALSPGTPAKQAPGAVVGDVAEEEATLAEVLQEAAPDDSPAAARQEPAPTKEPLASQDQIASLHEACKRQGVSPDALVATAVNDYGLSSKVSLFDHLPSRVAKALLEQL